jgi:hypothetical protein
MDYQDKMRIDRDALDEALMEQPGLFLGVSQEYAMAVSNRDRCKADVELVHAKASLSVRQMLEEEGKKATEAIIASLIELDKNYRRAFNAYLESKADAERLSALKESFGQRGYVLKDLCGLYVAGYFATASVGGSDTKEIAERGYTKRREQLARRRGKLGQ